MNVLILAGERPGGDPMALAEGVANKTEIIIDGQSMFAHVLSAVQQLAPSPRIFVSGNPPNAASSITVIPTAHTPCSSILKALEDIDFPVFVTTADHPLLTPSILNQFLQQAAALEGDVCIGMVPLWLVQQHYPQNQRTRLRFSDGSFSGANLFMLRNTKAMALIDFWRQMEANRKSPWRMLHVLGIGSVLRYFLGRLSLLDVLEIINERTGCTVAAVMLDDPHAAIDVDKPSDLALVREILALRKSETTS